MSPTCLLQGRRRRRPVTRREADRESSPRARRPRSPAPWLADNTPRDGRGFRRASGAPVDGAPFARLRRVSEAELNREREAAVAPRRRAIAGAVGGVVLGLVLVVAAGLKALDPHAFAEEIAAQGVTFGLPALAVALVALGLEMALSQGVRVDIRRQHYDANGVLLETMDYLAYGPND